MEKATFASSETLKFFCRKTHFKLKPAKILSPETTSLALSATVQIEGYRKISKSKKNSYFFHSKKPENINSENLPKTSLYFALSVLLTRTGFD